MESIWRGRRGAIVLVATVVVLALGVIGASEYLRALHDPVRPTDVAYLTLQTFVLNLSGTPGGIGYPWPLEVARFLAPLLLASVTVLALLTIFRDQLDGWRSHFRKGHIVLCGLGDEGLALLRTLRRSTRQVVVVERAPTREIIAEARRLGALVLLGDARDSEVLQRAGVVKSDSVVILCGTDAMNGEILSAVEAQVAGREQPICVQVQIQSLALAEHLLAHELRFGSRPGCVAADYVCQPEIAARRLIAKFPPASSHSGWGPIVVEGSGQIPEAVVIRIAQEWEAIDGAGKLLVNLIGPDSETLVRHIRRRHPKVDDLLDLAAGGYGDKVSISGSETVYLCYEDESESLAEGLALQMDDPSPARTIVLTIERLSLPLAIGEAQDPKTPLECFGVLDALCDPETLLGGFLEELACAIHKQYVTRHSGNSRTDRSSLVSWDQLGSELRGQNRGQAMHYVEMLDAIRARAVPVLTGAPIAAELTDDEVEQLAMGEHQRWMDLKIRGGWVKGDRNNHAKRHPDIDSWDNLDVMTQEKDRDVARDMPHLLASLSYRVARDVPLSGAVEPPAVEGSSTNVSGSHL